MSMTGEDCPVGLDRPLVPLISSLIDAAHESRQDQKLLHPKSQQYAMFEWQLQEAAAERHVDVQSRRGAGSVGSSGSYATGSALGGSKHGVFCRRSSTGASVSSFDLDEGGPPTSNLEITCEYDANFQTAGIQGRQGLDVRPLPQAQIGPVALLFRWYTRRATQFSSGHPRQGALTDAPAMPAADLLAAAKSLPASANSEVTARPSRESLGQASKRSVSGERSSTASVSDRMTRRSSGTQISMSQTSGSPTSAATSGRPPKPLKEPAASTASWDEGLPARGGRSLNRALDPTMSLVELCEMLEEMDIIPHQVSRQDVSEAFKAASMVVCTPEGQLPSSLVRPDEIRYPQFCDILVRLALAAEALKALGGPDLPARPQCPPNVAIRALMEFMGLACPNVTVLKRRLDALARVAGDRGAKRNAIKWMYVSQESAMAASRARPLPLASGWNISSPSRAPEELHDELMSSDKAAAIKYLPNWKEFPLPALDLGIMQPDEIRCLRVVLRNRGALTMTVRVDTCGAADHLAASFSEQLLPAGVPRVIEVDAKFLAPGEYTGELRIYSRIRSEMEQRVNSVPFYALVPGADPEARFPKARSERLDYCSKSLPIGASGATASVASTFAASVITTAR